MIELQSYKRCLPVEDSLQFKAFPEEVNLEA